MLLWHQVLSLTTEYVTAVVVAYVKADWHWETLSLSAHCSNESIFTIRAELDQYLGIVYQEKKKKIFSVSAVKFCPSSVLCPGYTFQLFKSSQHFPLMVFYLQTLLSSNEILGQL